jgi:hypothetical protein
MPAGPQCETSEKIDKLANLSLSELKQSWLEVYGQPAPRDARAEYLIRAIAYRIQEQAFGRLALPVSKRLANSKSDRRGARVDHAPSKSKLCPGSRLLREWQGTTYEVEVVDGGFVFASRQYRSLSEIARKITGTRWSGPLFFGLRRNGIGAKAAPQFVVDLSASSGAAKRKPILTQPETANVL